MTFDGNEGADHDRPVDTDEDNSYPLSVEATSGTGDRVRTATQTITVEVVNVNEPPGRPPAPVVEGQSDPQFPWIQYILVRPSATQTPNTGTELTAYAIQYRIKGSDRFIDLLTDAEPDWQEAKTPDLPLDRTYEVRVRAINDEGAGEWSPSAEATLSNRRPTGESLFEPDDLVATAGGAAPAVCRY